MDSDEREFKFVNIIFPYIHCNKFFDSWQCLKSLGQRKRVLFLDRIPVIASIFYCGL